MKLIHVSDLRLNSACEEFGPLAANRQEELWDTFREICRACNNRQAGLLLLSGNVFDREPTFAEMDKMKDILKTLNSTAVVWIAGYKDFVGKEYSYVNYPWPECVHIIRSAERVHMPGVNCYVTGVSYTSPDMNDEILPYLKADKTGFVQILMLCGDEDHMNLHHERLAAKGYNYVALGGKTGFSIWENERCAYSGSPEPLGMDETGNHGYLLVDVTEKGTAIEMVDIAKLHYKMAMLYIDEKMTLTDIAKRWKAEKKEKEGELYKLVIKGRKAADIDFQALKEITGAAEIIDSTEKSFDIKTITNEHRNDILGAFIKSLEDEMGTVKENALDIGISALLKGDSL